MMLVRVRQWSALLLLASVGSLGCKGSERAPSITPDSGQPFFDSVVVQRDSTSPADSADAASSIGDRSVPAGDSNTIAVNTQPGDPCVRSYLCSTGQLCVSATCRKACEDDPCNAKSAACAANEACRPASSFSGACMPATGQDGTLCGGDTGTVCAAGTKCASPPAPAKARCMKSCKPCPADGEYCSSEDCPDNRVCAKTSITGCYVCMYEE